MQLCEYGCGQEAKFQTKGGKWTCEKSSSSCPAIKKKNSEKIKQAHIDGRIPGWNPEKRGWSKGLTKENSEGVRKNRETRIKNGKTFLTSDILLNKHPNYQTFKLRNRLIEEGIKANKCEICGLSDWQNKNIQCQLHHIDGNKKNHLLENLQILCPNCHSQTDNWTSKNSYLGL